MSEDDKAQTNSDPRPTGIFTAYIRQPGGDHLWTVRATAEFDVSALASSAVRQIFSSPTLLRSSINQNLTHDATLTVQLHAFPNGASLSIFQSQEETDIPFAQFVYGTAHVLQTRENGQDDPSPAFTDDAMDKRAPDRETVGEIDEHEAQSDEDDNDTPPRDAAERLAFASWAIVTGKSARGIFQTLPVLDQPSAEKLSIRLSERTGGSITVDDILDSETIEQLADVMRKHIQIGELNGLVRTLRSRPSDTSPRTPVFVFHPAGANTMVYEPLMRHLHPDVPVYGLERHEGPVEVRAAQYVPLIREIQGDGPYVLVGWSLGGFLAYFVAQRLREEGADVKLVAAIDSVMPAHRTPDGPDEIRARWERYAKFAKRTYQVDFPLPYDKLVAAGDDQEQIKLVMDLVKLSGAKIPGGIIEHQRTSWIDNRALQTAELTSYDGAMVLYTADKYQDDLIEMEPDFGQRTADGGWGPYVPGLEIIHLGGEHLALIDEPKIFQIGADLNLRLSAIDDDTSA